MGQLTEDAMLLAIKETMESALRNFADEMRRERERDISMHQAACPWGNDYKVTKARMVGFLIAVGAFGGSLGAGLASLLAKIL